MEATTDSELKNLLEEMANGTSTLVEQVYETLLRAVLSGLLKPGEVVSVVKLSARLGVSRTPVHEAIRQLVHDGLVVQEANHRPVIARFSSSEVQDIYDMRLLLECEAAYRAATRLDRPSLQQLRQELDDLMVANRNKKWLRDWADHDSRLHDVIASGSGSDRLADDIRRYRRLHHGFNALCTNPADLEQALEEHQKILDALEARNADGARKAMQLHLMEWQAYFSRSVTHD